MKAPAAKKIHRVSRGNLRITIYRWTHPGTGAARWRFAWRDGDRWRYHTNKTLEGAEGKAAEVLADMAAGTLVMAGLPPARQRFLAAVHEAARDVDEAAVMEFLRARKTSGDVAGVVADYLTHKRAEAGENTRHLANVERDLSAMAKAFPGKHMSDIGAADLAKWWTDRNEGKSRKTAKDVRGNLCSLWKWAAAHGYAVPGASPAEKLPRYALAACERRVLSLDELRRLMDAVAVEFRPWAVLGAFAGLRPEEIAPPRKAGMSKAAKRGLRCEEIDWGFGVIRIAAEVSKVGTVRIVPLTDACRDGLEWAGIRPGMTGPVQPRNASEAGETKRLGTEIFGGAWPQDALRHSYGSYRNAMLRNLPAVAEEMGTSVAMLNRHYHNPQPMENGAAWFAFRFRSDETKENGGNCAAV